jgi:transcriptional regulator with XRE-family HTH domain
VNNINLEIGKKIKKIRKSKNLTIEAMGKKIFKSKSTVSKYEKGTISIDIVTLYSIAKALNVRAEQLLPVSDDTNHSFANDVPSTFFKDSSKYYAYYFDGRNNTICRCVIDIFSKAKGNKYTTMLYMNVPNFEEYQICENTYVGYTEHYDTLTKMVLNNQATSIESINISILASFLESNQKWGLMSGLSFRPFMPIALKILLSKNPLEETYEFTESLKISKGDYRLMKIFNMFSVT